MKFAELPKKYQRQAAQWAVEAWNEIYREQGIPEIDETAPEVQEFLDVSGSIARNTIEEYKICVDKVMNMALL